MTQSAVWLVILVSWLARVSAWGAEVDGYLELDGFGSYAELPDDLGSDLEAMTVECWVRWDAFRYFSPVLHFGDRVHGIGCNNRFASPWPQAFVQPGGSVPITAAAADVLVPGRWIHLAVTLGAGRLELFLNGISIASNAAPVSVRQVLAGAPKRWLGRSPWENNGYFRGAIDELRVWDRVLTPAQLRAVGGRRLTQPEPGLVAAWTFDGGGAPGSPEASRELVSGSSTLALRGGARIVKDTTGRSREWVEPGVVRVRTRGKTGAPLAARLRLWEGAEVVGTWVAGADGLAVLQAPSRAGRYRLQATHGESGIWQPLEFSQTTEVLEYTLSRAPQLEGRVVALDGSAQRGVHVVVDRLWPPPFGRRLESHLMTDDEGRFAWLNPEPGTYVVRVDSGGRALEGRPRVQEERTIRVELGQPIPELLFQVRRLSLAGRWSKVDWPELPLGGSVSALAAEPDGTLWLGTGAGLMRFDRRGLQRWTSTNGWSAREATSLAVAPDRKVWVGTEAGLRCWEAGQIRVWPGSPTGRCEQVTVATDGRVWLTEGERLGWVLGTNWHWFGPADGLSGGPIRLVQPQPDGSVAVGMFEMPSGGVLARADHLELPDAEAFRRYGLSMPENATPASSYSQLPEGVVWRRYRDYIAEQSAEGWRFLPPPKPFSKSEDLRSKAVRGFDGHIWMACGSQGLFRWDPQPPFTLTRADGLPSSVVTASARDASGQLWIGTKLGLTRWSATSTETMTTAQGLPATTVTAIAVDAQNAVWVGTSEGLSGGVARYGPNGDLTTPIPLAVPVGTLRAEFGSVWLATSGAGFQRWNGVTLEDFGATSGVYQPYVSAILPLSESSAWFAGRGLFRVEANHGEPLALPVDNAREIGSSFAHGPDGSVWVGSLQQGLFRWRAGQFDFVGPPPSIGLHWIKSIVVDHQGRVWCGTPAGIAVFDGELWSYVGPRDGLPSEAVNHVRLESGPTLWLGTDEGLVEYRVHTNRPIVRELHLESVAPGFVADRPATLRREVPVTWIAEVDPHPSPTRLRWRVHGPGTNEDWTPLQSSERFSWVPRQRGRHQIEVVAVDRDLNRSEPRSVAVDVTVHWSSDPRILVPSAMGGVGTLGLLISLVRRNRRQAREARWMREEAVQREAAQATQAAFVREVIASQEAERKRIAGELHDSLGQELLLIRNAAQSGDLQQGGGNPQFRQISDRASKAIQEIRQIAYALRPQELDRLGLTRALRTLAEEVCELGALELEIECEDLDGRLSPEAEISLYRMLQEALSNTLRYADARRLVLRLRCSEGLLAVLIRDDGRGFDAVELGTRTQRGMGLAGIEERARLLGGHASIQSATGEGTVVEITLPCAADAPRRT